MVFVKVRETYDLHTIPNKMSVIAIHTPKSEIIKKNYPGLLMQCKAYRPVSCDVRVACASTMPLDPLNVGTTSGDIAPEDLFNPILYKATSNFGMSQIESRILSMNNRIGIINPEIDGPSAMVDNDTVTDATDEFSIYYGLLSDTNSWRHANPQSGFEMSGLKPLVYEMLYSFGDNKTGTGSASSSRDVDAAGPGVATPSTAILDAYSFRGNAKPMPFINCTAWTSDGSWTGFVTSSSTTNEVPNYQTNVPAVNVMCGVIIVPPSRLHQLFYRMVVEWTLEFSAIRSVTEITSFSGLQHAGNTTHYMSYNYSNTSKALGLEETNLTNDASMVSANVGIEKVM